MSRTAPAARLLSGRRPGSIHSPHCPSPSAPRAGGSRGPCLSPPRQPASRCGSLFLVTGLTEPIVRRKRCKSRETPTRRKRRNPRSWTIGLRRHRTQTEPTGGRRRRSRAMRQKTRQRPMARAVISLRAAGIAPGSLAIRGRQPREAVAAFERRGRSASGVPAARMRRRRSAALAESRCAARPVPGRSSRWRRYCPPDPSVRWRIAGSVVQRSTNGGARWDAVPTGVASALTAGAAPSASVCWLVGRAGVVLLSTDGLNWRRVAFPEVTDLSAIQATDARTASVSTADGRTFSTTDGGATWVRRPPQDF